MFGRDKQILLARLQRPKSRRLGTCHVFLFFYVDHCLPTSGRRRVDLIVIRVIESAEAPYVLSRSISFDVSFDLNFVVAPNI